MKLGIMQPYFFPYIGYFQLINVVDKFVFYDDVGYIKNGWINRNRILINKDARYITVPLKNASAHRIINEVEFIDNRNKIKKTILSAYSKAPYFKEVWPLVEKILEFETNKIGTLAQYSVIQICKYLDINTKFECSSKDYMDTSHLRLEKRLIAICKINKASEYIDSIGGIELYSKDSFDKEGINLSFLKPNEITYRQFTNKFISQLSIIDIIMFNSKESIHLMLDSFELL